MIEEAPSDRASFYNISNGADPRKKGNSHSEVRCFFMEMSSTQAIKYATIEDQVHMGVDPRHSIASCKIANKLTFNNLY